MYIIYEFIGDKIIKYIPDNCQWTLGHSGVNDAGYEVGEIFLEIGGEKHFIVDAEYWTSGRPKLSIYCVEDYYNSVIDKVAEILANEDVRILNLNKIMDEVLPPFWSEWQAKGYVED